METSLAIAPADFDSLVVASLISVIAYVYYIVQGFDPILAIFYVLYLPIYLLEGLIWPKSEPPCGEQLALLAGYALVGVGLIGEGLPVFGTILTVLGGFAVGVNWPICFSVAPSQKEWTTDVKSMIQDLVMMARDSKKGASLYAFRSYSG